MSVSKLSPDTSKEFLEANKDALVVLVFDAEFTEQKDVVDNAVKVLSNDLKDKIVIGTVDVEVNNDLATKFSITSVPMVACLKGDKVVRRVDTLEPAKLTQIIGELLRKEELPSGDIDSDADPKKRFQEYLKRLVNRAPVMVFMKGEPKVPRCGFSKQLVELLARHDIKYDTFDILLDEEVRQGLKEYSEWPTYPQIYAKGDFVGGLDILKQLEESGELERTLKGES